MDVDLRVLPLDLASESKLMRLQRRKSSPSHDGTNKPVYEVGPRPGPRTLDDTVAPVLLCDHECDLYLFLKQRELPVDQAVYRVGVAAQLLLAALKIGNLARPGCRRFDRRTITVSECSKVGAAGDPRLAKQRAHVRLHRPA